MNGMGEWWEWFCEKVGVVWTTSKMVLGAFAMKKMWVQGGT